MKQYQIKYQTNKYLKSTTFFGTYQYALELYFKIKWENKALWDITNVPELILTNEGDGQNQEFFKQPILINSL